MTRKTTRLLTLSAIIGLATAMAGAAHADDKFSGSITGGVAYVPDYEGSSDYEIAPVIMGKLNYGTYYLETAGAGLRANVSPSTRVEFGPVISARLGRDDVDNNRVDNMREIDTTVEGGAFIKVPFRQVIVSTDELSFEAQILTDLGGEHDGTIITFGPSYGYMASEKLRLGLGVSATYASDNYNETYFGIDADNAARSGLAQYSADGGIKDVGVKLSATYLLNNAWSLTGFAGYKQLLGDASDSPIVDDEGSAGQGVIGTGLTYSFH